MVSRSILQNLQPRWRQFGLPQTRRDSRHCAISRFQMSLVSDLDEVANVTTEWLSTVLYGAILNELGDDGHSIRDAKPARLENRETRLRKDHTLLHGIDEGFKGESV
jgi:hypothetical protein